MTSTIGIFPPLAWTTDYSSATLLELNDKYGYTWTRVNLWAANCYTKFEVILGNVYFEVISDDILFLLTWSRVCLSLDTVAGRLVLAANGKILEEKVRQEVMEEDKWRPAELSLVLGNNPNLGSEDT